MKGIWEFIVFLQHVCNLEIISQENKGHYSRLIGKDPDAGRDWGQEEKGTTEDEMVGWHHRLDGEEFE